MITVSISVGRIPSIFRFACKRPTVGPDKLPLPVSINTLLRPVSTNKYCNELVTLTESCRVKPALIVGDVFVTNNAAGTLRIPSVIEIAWKLLSESGRRQDC